MILTVTEGLTCFKVEHSAQRIKCITCIVMQSWMQQLPCILFLCSKVCSNLSVRYPFTCLDPWPLSDPLRALELQPYSLKPLLRRAMAYESLERYRKAYVDYKTVLQIDTGVQAAHDSVHRSAEHKSQTRETSATSCSAAWLERFYICVPQAEEYA